MVTKRNNDWSPRSSDQLTARPLLAVSGQPDPIGAQQSNPSQRSKQLLVCSYLHICIEWVVLNYIDHVVTLLCCEISKSRVGKRQIHFSILLLLGNSIHAHWLQDSHSNNVICFERVSIWFVAARRESTKDEVDTKSRLLLQLQSTQDKNTSKHHTRESSREI